MGYTYKKTAKDGSPRYYAIYKLNGRWKWESAGRRKQAAEALLKRREMEIATGTYGQVKDIQFTELVDKFLEGYVEIRLKPRTIKDYSEVCEGHLIPYFGKKNAPAITTGDCQAFIRHELSKGLQPRTVNNFLTILGKIFNQAIKWGYAEKNPVSNVDRPRQPQKEMDFLTPEEVRRLYDACDPDFLPYPACAINTGVRQGELLAMIYLDLDSERKCIHVRRSISGGYLTEPKSYRSRRTVMMTPSLCAILAEHKARTGGKPDDLVFPGPDGGYMSPHVLMGKFRKALKAAGLREITWHSLRHTYAALMIALGENIKFIQNQMGHSSITTTLDRYGHLLPHASLGVGERLDNFIFGDDVEHYPQISTWRGYV
ncbi:MAG: site-specific integrase [Actinomycetota bacterium]|nr:site-specific integrase [Actinomycetota bacterium]